MWRGAGGWRVGGGAGSFGGRVERGVGRVRRSEGERGRGWSGWEEGVRRRGTEGQRLPRFSPHPTHPNLPYPPHVTGAPPHPTPATTTPLFHHQPCTSFLPTKTHTTPHHTKPHTLRHPTTLTQPTNTPQPNPCRPFPPGTTAGCWVPSPPAWACTRSSCTHRRPPRCSASPGSAARSGRPWCEWRWGGWGWEGRGAGWEQDISRTLAAGISIRVRSCGRWH